MVQLLLTQSEYLEFSNFKWNLFFKDIAVKRLKEKHLLPLKTDDNRLNFLSKIAGWLIGDGNLTRTTLSFCAEDEESLFKLKNEFQRSFYGISIKGPIKKVNNKGISLTLYVYDFSLAIFLNVLGVSTGNKTKKVFSIPTFIYSNSSTKKEFLNGLLGSELNTPCLDNSRRCSVISLWFGMSKNPIYEYYHLNFLNCLRKLLLEFGIETSMAKKIDTKRKNEYPRYGFYVKKNAINVLKLYKNISMYCFVNKYITFRNTINSILENYRKMLIIKNKYDKVKVLQNKGLSTRRVSCLTNIPKSTVHKWFKHKPNYLVKLENLQEFLNSDFYDQRK